MHQCRIHCQRQHRHAGLECHVVGLRADHLAATTQGIFDGLLAAFHEDREMITAQARNMALKPGVPMLPLAMDSALMQFRRLVTMTLDAERGTL